MHRRAGKSVFCCARLVEAATQNPRHAYHYLGPTYRQTKAIAWRYAKDMAQAVGATASASDLKLEFPNGATIELLGASEIDSLRGRFSNGIVIDEAQLLSEELWAYVIRPILADRAGWAFLTGTPAGWHNLLGWSQRQEQFFRCVMPYSETQALSEAEVEDMRRGMSEAAFDQEMRCSFDAALQGAFYRNELNELFNEGRYTAVKYDDRHPVMAALDLGYRDAMAWIFAQSVGTELHAIGCRTFHFTSLPDQIRQLRQDLGFTIDRILAPHDVEVHELGTGLTRRDVLEEHGYSVETVPNQSIDEGIEASRQLLRHVWIDQENASELYEALSAYRAVYDERRQVYHKQPLHDWSSHLADAFRMLALGDRAPAHRRPKPRNMRGLGVV